MQKRIVYLDNNATTPVAPEVAREMAPYLKEYYFNPSSHYDYAREVKEAVIAARSTIGRFLGASTGQIVFTGCASESNNWALTSALSKRRHIITTEVEHPSIYGLCEHLKAIGFRITLLPVNERGELDPKDLVHALDEDTAIVSIMHANNETGVIFPIEKLSRIVKMTDPQILFHTDATQTVGKIPINLGDHYTHVDLLSFSGHKIYAPKGIGVLYLRQGVTLPPLIHGGHQEFGHRAGTENVPYIMGLAKACQLAQADLEQGEKNLQSWRDRWEQFALEHIPAIKINGRETERLGNTSSVSFSSIEGEGILYALSEQGICASTGSACSSDSLLPSHVLQAMKIPFEYAHGTLRLSWGRYNTEEDFEILCRELPPVINNLRKMSPFWKS
jgi:cysteine desulfurase